MNIKKFTAGTMDQALAQVKSALGGDAVILHTRFFKTGGVLGIGGRRLVEVTASDQIRVPERTERAASRTAIERAYRLKAGFSADLKSLKGDVGSLKTMIAELTKQTRPSRTAFWPEALKGWHRHLCERGISEGAVIDLLEPLAARVSGEEGMPGQKIRRMVFERLTQSLKTAAPVSGGEPGRPTMVALVGPTGVGKTTTIAKLAAHHVLRERQAVGLMTLDTYRIAAVEQLRTYARIIDVPLEVVLAPSDLPAALERLEHCSLIFVDTAGRSQRDTMKMNDLKNFLARRRPDQIHLVLSATIERAAVEDVVERFDMYGPDRILLTKLDELPSCGRLLEISRLTAQPVSYLATGQDVPDDIESARPERLAALIAGEENIDG
ncbi:MAG: flagellar biosynthesis protein FlhF [Planctomycetota bacterium]